MSKQRQKGTQAENWLLAHLRTVWPHAERAPLKGVLDMGDYTGLFYKTGGEQKNATRSLPIEMKKHATPRFPEWIRTMKRKTGDGRWVLIWAGDMRTEAGQPIMVVPFELGMDMLSHYFGPIGSRIPVDRVETALPSPMNWGTDQ